MKDATCDCGTFVDGLEYYAVCGQTLARAVQMSYKVRMRLTDLQREEKQSTQGSWIPPLHADIWLKN